MEMSMSKQELEYYLLRQLEIFFPDGQTEKHFINGCSQCIDFALEKLEYCFKHINNVAFSNENGQTFFSHLHSDQYTMFLYYFMNILWKEKQNRIICDKTMLLCRYLSSCFISYKCELPDIFVLVHPVGTVLGNAVYSDYLVVLSNVTVNTAKAMWKCKPPILGKGLYLSTGSRIIGNQTIGDRVAIGTNAVVYKTDIDDDKLVLCDVNGGGTIIKDNKNCIQQSYFRTAIR